MTDHSPRLFADDATIVRLGERLLDRSVPRAEWTHEAHLATCLWLVRERPDIDLDQALPGIIRGYNEAVGGVNDDSQGYHDTITRTYLVGVRAHLAGRPPEEPLAEAVNALLASPTGKRDWPLAFYSRDRLFSVAARRAWVEPDLQPLPARTHSASTIRPSTVIGTGPA